MCVRVFVYSKQNMLTSQLTHLDCETTFPSSPCVEDVDVLVMEYEPVLYSGGGESMTESESSQIAGETSLQRDMELIELIMRQAARARLAGQQSDNI